MCVFFFFYLPAYFQSKDVWIQRCGIHRFRGPIMYILHYSIVSPTSKIPHKNVTFVTVWINIDIITTQSPYFILIACPFCWFCQIYDMNPPLQYWITYSLNVFTALKIPCAPLLHTPLSTNSWQPLIFLFCLSPEHLIGTTHFCSFFIFAYLTCNLHLRFLCVICMAR